MITLYLDGTFHQRGQQLIFLRINSHPELRTQHCYIRLVCSYNKLPLRLVFHAEIRLPRQPNQPLAFPKMYRNSQLGLRIQINSCSILQTHNILPTPRYLNHVITIISNDWMITFHKIQRVLHINQRRQPIIHTYDCIPEKRQLFPAR